MRARPLIAAVAGGAALLALPTPPAPARAAEDRADVVAVAGSGRPGALQLRVTVRSPDVDCSRYADWWEVLRPDGSLVYRRILAHSHANEQPFTRAGGPVAARADEPLVVRAHMHPTGYGGAVFRGSVTDGFARWQDVPADFAPELADAPPRPGTCRY